MKATMTGARASEGVGGGGMSPPGGARGCCRLGDPTLGSILW